MYSKFSWDSKINSVYTWFHLDFNVSISSMHFIWLQII